MFTGTPFSVLAELDVSPAGRELWRLHGYLAAIAVAGASPLWRSFLPWLAAAVQQYA